MTDLVRAEWLKLRTTRAWWAYLASIALVVGIAVAGGIGSAPSAERADPSYGRELVDAVDFVGLFALILGITVVAGEFRHGTVTPTFLATPVRERVLAAKALASALFALLFGLLALAVVAAIAVPWLAVLGAGPGLSGEVATRAGHALLGVVLWGLMGFAVGALVQAQVAALVGTLLWLSLGEALLLGLAVLLDVEGLTAYLPFQALDAAGGGATGPLSFWSGLAVSCGWIVLLAGAGLVRLLRRDIT